MVLDFRQMVEMDLQKELPMYLLSCYGLYDKNMHGEDIGGDAFMLPGEPAQGSAAWVLSTARQQDPTSSEAPPKHMPCT
jgi:hypothetical protein